MIKKFVALLAVPALLVGMPTEAVRAAETASQVVVQDINSQKEQDIKVTFDEKAETKKNAAGIVMMNSEYKFPVIEIKGNTASSSKINAYYKGVKKQFEESVKQLTSYAEEDYKLRDKEQIKSWTGYTASMKYHTGRVDNKVISLIKDYDEYTGGAHPNASRFTGNFSSVSGEQLNFKDIVKDETAARKAVVDYIIKQVKNADYKDYLFDEYEKSVSDLITDTTWYFTNEGLVIVANEYIIGPHAMGIKEFTIPYAQADFLKDDYQLK